MFKRFPGTALLIVAACALSVSAGAQIYRVTDEKEGVVFTDRPKTLGDDSTVQEVELAPTNRAEPVAMPQSAERKPSAAPEEPAQPTVRINAPENESTIAMGPGNFTVSAAPEPPLGRGESLQLLMDGEPQGDAQRGTSWFLEGVLRGPHDLVVERRTAGGSVIARSEPVRVYVLRPSIIGR
jgi:hypothetical protein